MDWCIPELKFKHLIQVRDEVGVDLADFEQCAELDNVRQLGLVIKILSPQWNEDKFFGDAIDDAHSQLFGRLEAFFPSAKSKLLKAMRLAQARAYQDSGSSVIERLGGLDSL